MQRQLKQIKCFYRNSSEMEECVNDYIIELYNKHGVTEPIIETNSEYITVIYNKLVDVVVDKNKEEELASLFYKPFEKY